MKIKNHSGDKTVASIPQPDSGVQLDSLEILVKTLKLYGVAAGTEYGLLLRNGRVLCAIPRDREVALKVLSLYQPQRIMAKLLATAFRWAARLGLHSHFLRGWKMDEDATGSGVPPGVMVGSSGHQCERAVVVTREADGWVVTKIAFGPKGEAILGGEGKMLQCLKTEFVGVPQLLSFEPSPDLTILRMRWQEGRAWQEESLVPLLALLDSWANRGVSRTLAEYDEWQIIRPLLRQFSAWEQCLAILVDRKFVPSIRHGDLTRPNLRVASDGQLQVHDWERGSTHGLPGLDLVHFMIQDRSFRSTDSPAQILDHVLKQLQAEPIASWLRLHGWNGLELELMALTFALNTATPYIDQRPLLEYLSSRLPSPNLLKSPHPPQRATPNGPSVDPTCPLVSIVTPSFKQVNFLKSCAASVQDQAGNFRVEHLIHDGGSGKEFHQWAESQTTALCVSERDDGMYDAINRGFRKASGNIIAWLNCDEQYLPGTLQRVVQFFDDHPTVDILFADVILVDEWMTPLAYRRAVLPTLGHIRYSHLSTFSAATFVRRRVLDDGHFLQTRWKTIADAVWIDELQVAGYRMATLHEPLAVFCMLGSNLGQSALLFQERREWEKELGTTNRWRKQWHVMRYRLERLRVGAYFMRKISICAYPPESVKRVQQQRWVSGQWNLARNQAAVLRSQRDGALGGFEIQVRKTRWALIHAAILITLAIYLDSLKQGDAVKAPSILLISLMYLSFRSKLRDLISIVAVYFLTSCYVLSERPPDVLVVRLLTFFAGAILAIFWAASLRRLEEWIRSTAALIRKIGEPMILTDRQGKVILVNKMACEWLHGDEQQFLKQKLLPLAPDVDGSMTKRLMIEDWKDRPPENVLGLALKKGDGSSLVKARVLVMGMGASRFYAFTLEPSEQS